LSIKISVAGGEAFDGAASGVETAAETGAVRETVGPVAGFR
jgi:hypothetical protein